MFVTAIYDRICCNYMNSMMYHHSLNKLTINKYRIYKHAFVYSFLITHFAAVVVNVIYNTAAECWK